MVDHNEYRRLTKLASLVSISVAIFLLIAKTIVWLFSNSLVLITSMMDSVFDMLASIVSFFILKYANKPADEDHSFGHGKIEHLGVLAQSLFISSSAIVIAIQAINKIINQQVTEQHNIYIIAVAILSIIVTFFLIRFQKYIIKKTKSSAIMADSMHYKMDLYLNLIIILAVVLSMLGFYYADAIFALIISLVIIYKGIKMLIEAMQSLVDHSIPEKDLQHIREIIAHEPKVLGVHDLRTRSAGNTHYIEFHLELDDDLSFKEVHTICDHLESALNELFSNVVVTIHPEPTSVALSQKRGTYKLRINKQLLELVQEQKQPIE